MLYPLSYEGRTATCYLPGRTQNCPGVPAAAKRSSTTLRACVGAIPRLVGARSEQPVERMRLWMVIGIGQAPPLPSDGIRSPSTRGAHEST
jgi:hypothetical protein